MKRKPLIILAIIAAFLLTLTFASPLVVKFQIEKQLRALGAEQASIERLYLNIWSGHFNVSNLLARKADTPELHIGYFETDLEMTELFNLRLHIDHLYLYDSQIPVIKQGDDVQIGPLTLPAASSATSADEDAETSWRWGLSSLQLKNLKFDTTLPDQSHRLQIDQGSLDLIQNWAPEKNSRIALNGHLNDSPFTIDSTSAPLASHPHASTRLTIDNLKLAPLTAPFIEGIAGQLSGQLDISLVQDDAGLAINQDGSIALSNFTLNNSPLDLSNRQLSWQGSSSVRLNQGVSITHQGTLLLNGLHLKQSQLSVDSESIRWEGKGSAVLDDAGLKHVTTDGSLTITPLALDMPKFAVREQQLALTGLLNTDLKQLSFSGQLNSQSSNIGLPHIDLLTAQRHWQGQVKADLDKGALDALEGELTLDGMAIHDKKQQPLLTLTSLSAPRFEIDTGLQLKAPRIKVGALELIDKDSLLSLKGAELSKVAADAAAARIGVIRLGTLQTGVTLDTQGQPRQWQHWLALLSPAETAEPKQAEATTQTESTPFRVQIDRFALQQPATLYFRDSTVKPARDLTTRIDQLELTEIDTGDSSPVNFSIAALINKFGALQLKGNYAAFAKQPNGNWSGKLKQLELPPFSPYMQRHSGYQLRSGQIALDTSGSIAKGQVDSKNSVVINNLQVKATAEKDAGEFDKSLGMPLTTVISILTDDDNNVELEIPVNGSTDDPKFGIQSVVNILMTKVAKEAAVSYLSSALQPYGALISLTRMAIKAGSGVSLEPVKFAPGSAELDAESLAYLAKIQAMLTERDGIRINACGLAVASDAKFLQDEYQARRVAEKKSSPATVSAAAASVPAMPKERLDKALLELAESRGDAVKRKLLTDQAIQPERLFSCLPEVDTENDGDPQVALGL